MVSFLFLTYVDVYINIVNNQTWNSEVNNNKITRLVILKF